jgi:hypothetical protein
MYAPGIGSRRKQTQAAALKPTDIETPLTVHRVPIS